MSVFRYASAAALIFLAVGSARPLLAQASSADIDASHNIGAVPFPTGNSEAALLERLQNSRLANTVRQNGMLREGDLDRLKQNPDALMELLRKNGLKPEALELIKKNPRLLDAAIDRVKKGEGLPDGARVPPSDVNSALRDLQKEKSGLPPSSRSQPGGASPQAATEDRGAGASTAAPVTGQAPGASKTNPIASASPEQEAPRLPMGQKLQGWAQRLQSLSPQFRDSPAMQKAVQTLAQSIGSEDPKWRKLSDAGESLRDRLSDWNKTARLERFLPSGKFQLPDVPAPEKMPNITLRTIPDRIPRDIGMPRIRSGELSGGGALTALAWLVGGVAGAVCLRRFWLYLQETSQEYRRKQALLNAWPVDPQGVSTREELIKAYEYLALSRLGLVVKSWNHLAIAAGLGDSADPLRRNAALCLTDAYEHARYAPLEEPLPNAVIVEARRHLCLLAGVQGV